VSQASGSAYVEVGKMKIAAAVYGPRAYTRKETFSEQALVQCELKCCTFADIERTPFIREEWEKEMSVLIQEALLPAIRLECYPKSEIDIYISVLESDGQQSMLAAAVNTASLALADAGIQMTDLVTAASALLMEHDEECPGVWMDCTRQEEQAKNGMKRGHLMLAMMPSFNEVTHCVMEGRCDVVTLKRAMDQCLEMVMRLHPIMTQVLLDHCQQQQQQQKSQTKRKRT